MLALAALVFSADASATVDKGVLSISPARRTVTARPPIRLAPTDVKNTTQVDMAVRVFPVLLFQNLDGSFGFNASPRELNEAKLQLGAGPTQFGLKPQRSQKVSLQWRLLPRKAKAAYLGMVVQGIPQLPGKKSVGTVLRLLSLNFLTLPGHWKITGKITKLHGQQAAPRVLEFLPRVRNTGQIHSQPQNGRCKIVDSSGAVAVGNLKFGTGIVLPGYEREYPIIVKKPNVLPAGSYSMRCAMRFGGSKSAKSLPFKLSGPNTLPTPSLKLTSVKATGEIGSSSKVRVAFANKGSAASSAALRVELKTVGGAAPPRTIARGRFPQGSVAAGAAVSTELTIGPKLAAGNYVADVVLSNGQQDVDELTSSFTATRHKSFFTRLWDWLKDHIAWLIALLALIGLLILFLLYRRRRREMEAELEAARAGHVPSPAAAPVAPAAPAPRDEPAPRGDGRVNVNTASVEELMTLPGVGRRAAERIVAQREASGPFTSLDQLGAIEGFHTERIKRLADSADI